MRRTDDYKYIYYEIRPGINVDDKPLVSFGIYDNLESILTYKNETTLRLRERFNPGLSCRIQSIEKNHNLIQMLESSDNATAEMAIIAIKEWLIIKHKEEFSNGNSKL